MGGVWVRIEGGVDVVDLFVVLPRNLGLSHVSVVEKHLYHPHLVRSNVVYEKKSC